MSRTAAVDRPDFHAWRAYRAVIDAEAAPVQLAVFRFEPEGRGRRGVWIHGGPSSGIRIGAVLSTAVEYSDPATGVIRRRRTYTAVADGAMTSGTTSAAPPTVEGLNSRSAAAALLYGRWIERRATHTHKRNGPRILDNHECKALAGRRAPPCCGADRADAAAKDVQQLANGLAALPVWE